MPLSFFDCFRVSVSLEGNALLSGIGSGGDVDHCIEGNVALPLNLFVSCRNSCCTLVNVSFLLDCDGLSPLFFLHCLQRWHRQPTLDAVCQCQLVVDFVLQPPWICGPTFCWCVFEFLRVFAFDDVVVEKTSVVSSSTFYINRNQYYILTYSGFNCLHTLELILISDVLEDGPIFLVSADYFHTEGNQYMYEMLLFVDFVLIQEGAAMLFFLFHFFPLPKKTHDPKPESNQSAYHGYKNEEENAAGGKHPQEM